MDRHGGKAIGQQDGEGDDLAARLLVDGLAADVRARWELARIARAAGLGRCACRLESEARMHSFAAGWEVFESEMPAIVEEVERLRSEWLGGQMVRELDRREGDR